MLIEHLNNEVCINELPENPTDKKCYFLTQPFFEHAVFEMRSPKFRIYTTRAISAFMASKPCNPISIKYFRMISTEHKQTIVLHNSELLEVIALTLDTTSICGNVMYLFKYRDQNIICTGDYTSSGKLYVNPNICPLIAQESQIHYLYADNTLAFSDNHYGITAKAASKYIVKHMSKHPHCTVHLYCGSYGFEPILVELSTTHKIPIQIDELRAGLFKHIKNKTKFAQTAEQVKIIVKTSACKLTAQEINHIKQMNILVMQCIDSDIKQTELQNNGIISINYSTHAPPIELEALVSVIRPQSQLRGIYAAPIGEENYGGFPLSIANRCVNCATKENRVSHPECQLHSDSKIIEECDPDNELDLLDRHENSDSHNSSSVSDCSLFSDHPREVDTATTESNNVIQRRTDSRSCTVGNTENSSASDVQLITTEKTDNVVETIDLTDEPKTINTTRFAFLMERKPIRRRNNTEVRRKIFHEPQKRIKYEDDSSSENSDSELLRASRSKRAKTDRLNEQSK